MAENNVPKPIQVIDIDAYSPPQIASRIDKIATVKARLSFAQTFILGVLAGVYIGIGAQFATLVTCDSTLHYGLTSLIAGIVFSLGLMLVVIGGAELFTGNCLIIMGYVGKRITTRELLNNWIISFLGNLVGSLTMVCWMYKTHQWEFFHNMVGAKALLIAHTKVNLTFKTALARGVLCNAMVCLAVWLCFSGRSVADKVLSIVFPIGGFVASGFEHCVANMYFIPIGIVLRKNPAIVAAAEKMAGKTVDLSQLTWNGFFVNNLLPVTLGNIVGGVILVGIVFWFVYLRPHISLAFSVKQDFFHK
ncbi:MAG: formate/nitrite transporter family protein [Candidatus Brocadia sp. AMX2]|uniref:formate/nitrite transporter family protein n=1 Tax=Candidatus Brocadia sp. AMX2 TaxID=2293635 RepID=UPI000ECA3CF9|nr:formate/nitrite transporter family protein [Candidatus Brocadia sp. AMX2]MBC6930709.1 formate/nitrite transporter family protein [Candidatus Brocadia sp.]KAA0245648.1 MAG: formate/nitrite transporter family protein [Candidatus Brocadia sp. AMX2]MCE7865384.1 formate/nitrite transporter family protein [Candidatus Brocadia sp. AMX2]MCQ3915930.1 formate/nitrite transporter family protein [Candidatus Brocadia sp.]MDL1933999.1 formate/nitrite transporter family protein [Candidatus Brocadia sp. AM